MSVPVLLNQSVELARMAVVHTLTADYIRAVVHKEADSRLAVGSPLEVDNLRVDLGLTDSSFFSLSFW